MKFWTADVSGLTRTEVKAKLWDELCLKADIGTKGINISGKALDALHEDGSVPLQASGGRPQPGTEKKKQKPLDNCGRFKTRLI